MCYFEQLSSEQLLRKLRVMIKKKSERNAQHDKTSLSQPKSQRSKGETDQPPPIPIKCRKHDDLHSILRELRWSGIIDESAVTGMLGAGKYHG